MKVCIDVNDKFEAVFNKLSDRQKERLIKGLSAYVNTILSVFDGMEGQTLDSALNMVTSAMYLVSSLLGEKVKGEDNGEEEE